MSEAKLVLTTDDGSQFDLSAHLLAFRYTATGQAFCQSFSATVLNPPLPYVRRLVPASSVQVETADATGRTLRFDGKVDRVRLSRRRAGEPGLVELEGRGIEAELVDSIIGPSSEAVCDLADCPQALLWTATRLAGLTAPAISAVCVDPQVSIACRIGVSEASPFEVLRDVADHIGYGFSYNARDSVLQWIRPDCLPSAKQASHHLLTEDQLVGETISEQDARQSYQKDLDDWF